MFWECFVLLLKSNLQAPAYVESSSFAFSGFYTASWSPAVNRGLFKSAYTSATAAVQQMSSASNTFCFGLSNYSARVNGLLRKEPV